jgi:hypothetical protein
MSEKCKTPPNYEAAKQQAKSKFTQIRRTRNKKLIATVA